MPPLAWMADTAASSLSCFRPANTTFAPCSANRSAIRWPMPLPPPVTNATRSFSKFSRNTLMEKQIITRARGDWPCDGIVRHEPEGSTASLAALVAVNVLNFYDRHVIGALTEPIRKEFALSDPQIGLMSSAFIWLYAFVGLLLGRVADAWRRKRLLACGMLVWSGLTALAATATTPFCMLSSRIRGGRGRRCSRRYKLDRRSLPRRRALSLLSLA